MAGVSLAGGLDPAATQFSAFLRCPGGAVAGGGPLEAVRVQVHAVATTLLHRRQLGLLPALIAIAGPLAEDPALQLLQACPPVPPILKHTV